MPAPADLHCTGLRGRAVDGQCSDHSNPSQLEARDVADGGLPLWRASSEPDVTSSLVARFHRRAALSAGEIGAWTGGTPGPTKGTVEEWFIYGTVPGAATRSIRRVLLYTQSCGGWRVDPVGAGARAVGVGSRRTQLARSGPARRRHARTVRLADGVLLGGIGQRRLACSSAVAPRPKPDPKPDHGGGDHGGGGHGGGGDGKPTPPPEPTQAPPPPPTPKP